MFLTCRSTSFTARNFEIRGMQMQVRKIMCMFESISVVLLLNFLVRRSFLFCYDLLLFSFLYFEFELVNILWSETFPSIGRVRVKHRGILLTLKGTVIRSGAIKMVEGDRTFECRRCKHRWVLCL